MKPEADAPATGDDGPAGQLPPSPAPPVVPGQRIGPEHRTDPDPLARPTDAEPTDAEQAEAAPVAGEPARAAPTAVELSEREREILVFERRWWKHAGAKEQAIRDSFDLSATRYYQLLNGLLDNPAALAADPVLVGRLRRLRATRSRTRRR